MTSTPLVFFLCWLTTCGMSGTCSSWVLLVACLLQPACLLASPLAEDWSVLRPERPFKRHQTSEKCMKHSESTRDTSRRTHLLHTFISWNVDFDLFLWAKQVFYRRNGMFFCIFFASFWWSLAKKYFCLRLHHFISFLPSTSQNITKKNAT